MVFHNRLWGMIEQRWPLRTPEIQALKKEVGDTSIALAGIIMWAESLQRFNQQKK